MKPILHIYSRVSSESQEDGGSLEAQQESGIQKSVSLGMDYKVWNEGAASSSNDNLTKRPVLRELLTLMEEGEVRHLFVWNTDRLSRNEEVWHYLKYQYLSKYDVNLHTPSGQFNLNDPMSKMIMGLLGSFSVYDNDLRTIRLTDGKVRSIREGGWKGGPPPFGYRLEDKKLVVDGQESIWVIKIHEMYRDNHTVDEIRTELMNYGVMTRRGNVVWSHGSIEKLLTNTHYDGYWYFTDQKSQETIRVECPRICDPTLISAVIGNRQKRSYGKSGTKRAKTSNEKHPYLLSKILRCGSCGSFYYPNRKINRQSSYYSCGTKTNKFRDKHTDRYVDCGSIRNLNLDMTDEAIWNLIKEVVANSNLYREEVKSQVFDEYGTYSERGVHRKKINRKIESLTSDKAKITDSIVNLTTESILSSTKDLERVVARLEKERLQKDVEVANLKEELFELDNRSNWVDWLGKHYQKMDDLDSLPLKEKRDFIAGLVSEIVVSEVDKQTHKIDILFKFPYVGDQLVWNEFDENGKRIRKKGYRLVEGKKVKSVKVDLLKKSRGIR